MWIEINTCTFSTRQDGFIELAFDGRHIYRAADSAVLDVAGLRNTEYAVAVEIDVRKGIVSFGRDYLGFFPLIYAVATNYLYLTDEYQRVVQWLSGRGVTLTPCEEAFALYFAMGYVPQGFSLYTEIHTCQNASVYRCRNGRIEREDIFSPIEPNPAFTTADLASCIDAEVVRCAAMSDRIDIWCSGGLDSSAMAYCFNSNGRKADLLTLSYGKKISAAYGEGEIPFVKEMAASCAAEIRYAELNCDNYVQSFDHFVRYHIGPVIDYHVPPKYALASRTHELAITGEGGDPLFAGVKNNMMLYAMQNIANASFGWLYAIAHQRFAEEVEKIFQHGADLKAFVVEYLERQHNTYPGNLLRRLFYINTLQKQGGLIFPAAYYATKRYGIKCRHPLTALTVYEAAFLLTDDKKYRYPLGKRALIDIFKTKLPDNIVARKKSGTRLYLTPYLKRMLPMRTNFSALASTGIFRAEFLERIDNSNPESERPVFTYALHTLNSWLNHNGDKRNASRISNQTDHLIRQTVGG